MFKSGADFVSPHRGLSGNVHKLTWLLYGPDGSPRLEPTGDARVYDPDVVYGKS